MFIPNSHADALWNRQYWSTLHAHNLPVRLPVGTIYIDGTVTTPHTCGNGRLHADGAMSGWTVHNHPTLTGCLTRVVQVGKGPCLRLSGTGYTADDPIEWVGDGESAIVEVEGSSSYPTGRHRFRNHTFSKAGCAFHALDGHYDDDGKFVKDEMHAELVHVDECEFYDVHSVFRSDNQQALDWRFDRPVVNGMDAKYNDLVFADIRRGGMVAIRDLKILHSRCTIFKVRDYSPNQCHLVCENFTRDRMGNADNYLTLFEYAGDKSNQFDWVLRVSGFIPCYQVPFDMERLYKVPLTLPRSQWKVDVTVWVK